MPDLVDISNVHELLSRIRKGLVPRSVRLFAAQGLLPVTREDLIRVAVLLAAEGDEEISATARATLAAFSAEHCKNVLRVAEVDSLEIDLLAKFVPDDGLWEAIVQDARTADETLRWLARSGTPRTQDAIVTNQRRLMTCLELLEDLRANPRPESSVLRRAREFEEEFLEKVCAWAREEAVELDLEPGPSIEDELAALKALGMRIQVIEPMPPPELEEAERKATPGIDFAVLRIARMNTYQRIMTALKGTREERLILARERNLLVVRAVIESPRLTDQDVEALAGMRSTNEEALRLIAKHGAWTRRYAILRNLVFNPKTPPGVTMPLVARLSDRDLGILSRDRNVTDPVRKFARQVRETRR
jgi:hypothetical protein